MESRLTPQEALQVAINRAGDQRALANMFGVSQGTVSNWLNHQKQLPAEYVLRAEKELGVSRHDLRPDIYPREATTGLRASIRFMGVDQMTGRVLAA